MKNHELCDKLTREIVGATVISVVPCTDAEGLFTLRLEKNKKRFEVRVSGSDLGWYYKIAGDK